MSNSGLITQSLLGTDNISLSIAINSTDGIVFNDSGANLNAVISWAGISTNNPDGFNIKSKLNMNSNDIDNINNINNITGGVNIASSSNFVVEGQNLSDIYLQSWEGDANDSSKIFTQIILNPDPTASSNITMYANRFNTGGSAGVVEIDGNLNVNAGDNISLNSTVGIYETAQIVRLRDGINDEEIVLDMGTNTDQNPRLTLTHSGQTSTIYNNDNLNIESDQQLFTTIEKTITIQSTNDNIHLITPSGKIFGERNFGLSDGEFVANTFTGSLNGTATTAVSATQLSKIGTSNTSAIVLAPNNTGLTSQIALRPLSDGTYNGQVEIDGKLLVGGQLLANSSILSSSTIQGTTITATTGFSGSLSGSATSLATTSSNANQTYYLPFVSSSATSAGQTFYTDPSGHITFNPSTNQLSTNGTMTNNGLTMNGSASQFLINNASASVPAISAPNAQLISFPSANITATTFTGNLSGNASTATTATNATNSAITDDNTNATYYPVFVSNNTGNLPLKVDKTTNPLSYNPSTGVLTSTTFTGALSGNSTTATTATNSNNSLIVSDNSSTTCYIPFTKSTASTGTNLPLYQDDTTTALTYTPSTSTLSCSYGQFGSGIINTSSLASNSSGGLTITGGNSGGLILNSGANTLQLQYNGTTIATVQSTGLAVSQINANGFNIYNGTFSPFQIASTTGISTFTNINTNGFTLPTSINTATFATNTLTITGSTGSTFRNYQIGFTGTTNTITTLSLTAFPVNAEYYVAIYNGGSGTLTINTGLGAGIKTTYASNITVLTGGYAIMKINYIPFTTGGNIYVVSVNNIA